MTHSIQVVELSTPTKAGEKFLLKCTCTWNCLARTEDDIRDGANIHWERQSSPIESRELVVNAKLVPNGK